MRNCVSINLRKNEIVIKISDDAEQKDIIDNLRRKLPELRKMYKNEKTPITVTGKILKNKEIDEIQELIKRNIDVEIDFDMPKSLGLSSITRTFRRRGMKMDKLRLCSNNYNRIQSTYRRYKQ